MPAEDQAALRRVATLVAHGATPEEVFAAVTRELGQLLRIEYADMSRYEPDRTTSVVTVWSRDGAGASAACTRLPLGGNNLSSLVYESGRPGRMDDCGRASGPAGVAARDGGVRSAVGMPILVEGRLWGMMGAGSFAPEPLPADTEARLADFTELLAMAIANAESRATLAQLVEEQAALRRVATQVARRAAPEDLFAAVVEEVGSLLAVDIAVMGRYEPDGRLHIVAYWGRAPDALPVGSRPSLGGQNLTTIVFETGLPARVDDYANVSGALGMAARNAGLRSAVGAPILVEGRVWGIVIAGSAGEPLAGNTEARLADFTELLATAIANAESQAGLARLAAEQAALRRVATLVARRAGPEDLFAAVVEEVGQLLPVEYAHMGRYEPDGTVMFIAAWGAAGPVFPVGTRVRLGGNNLATKVFETSRAARIESWNEGSGPLAVALRRRGVRWSVASPILVEGRLWGVMAAGSIVEQRLLPDTEARLSQVTELVATAIANAESRAALAASRARVVAAADEARRRIERDLHDRAQQRLVSLGLEVRAAQAAVPPGLEALKRDLTRAAEGVATVFEELREIAHGIHPAILSDGGLEPALRGLARGSPVPVELELRVGRRLPEPVEVGAYHVVSEALTNVAKHAQASVVHIELDAEDGSVRLAIDDDGVGGASPDRGSGLVGLRDRIEALGGTLRVASPVGAGTRLLIEIPLEGATAMRSSDP
jgi:signal transduction histidine kinase